jgi:hypothetical protein
MKPHVEVQDFHAEILKVAPEDIKTMFIHDNALSHPNIEKQ